MSEEQVISELEEKVIEVIKTCYDPEIPVNIYDLGLIYDISITQKNEVVVLMTLTSPACPSAGEIPAEVEMKVKQVEGVTDCKIIMTYSPAWDRSMMSDAALLELGLL